MSAKWIATKVDHYYTGRPYPDSWSKHIHEAQEFDSPDTLKFLLDGNPDRKNPQIIFSRVSYRTSTFVDGHVEREPSFHDQRYAYL